MAKAYGKDTLAAAGNKVLLAANAGVQYRLIKAVVTVSVEAASALVSLDDGTTVFWQGNADAPGHFPIDFSPDGFPWGLGKGIRLVVAGGDATAHAMVVAEKGGIPV